MNEEKREKIWAILNTTREALKYLKHSESEDLRQSVSVGRESVTKALEEECGISLERQIHISALTDEEWFWTARCILREIEDPFRVQNTYDKAFADLISAIWKSSEEELLALIKKAVGALKKDAWQDYAAFVKYLKRYPLWGTFDPEHGDWTTLELRAAVLKRHSYDFLWLYRRLEDYLSKRTLTAILTNWGVFDFGFVRQVKSIFTDYWEPDIFPNNRGDVLIDVGAYIGDSILSYVQAYGTEYRKIYAYEISPDSCAKMRENVKSWGLHDVVIRQRGVGSDRSEMFLSRNADDTSANQLGSNHEGGRVDVVRLDEDAPDATFIKMDIEGAEQDALLGCEGMIREKHPKLAICTYHGYEDIWKIPAMIDEMYPNYRFFMRHYGGELPPTEFVLLCNV